MAQHLRGIRRLGVRFAFVVFRGSPSVKPGFANEIPCCNNYSGPSRHCHSDEMRGEDNRPAAGIIYSKLRSFAPRGR